MEMRQIKWDIANSLSDSFIIEILDYVQDNIVVFCLQSCCICVCVCVCVYIYILLDHNAK